MPRPSNREERRHQIVSGLLAVMAKQGYESASIAQVARAAHLTPGLVHYHFHNKQEILLALLDQLADRHFEGLARRLAEAGPNAGRRLVAFIARHLALGADADSDALACWVMLGGEAIRQPAVRDALQVVLARLTAELRLIVEAGVEQREFRCHDPEATAAALLATIQGYFMLGATARGQIPRGSAAECTKRMAEGLLATTLPDDETQQRAD